MKKNKELKINDTIKVSKELKKTLVESTEKQRAIENGIVVLSQKLHQVRKAYWELIKIDHPETKKFSIMYGSEKGIITILRELSENEETE